MQPEISDPTAVELSDIIDHLHREMEQEKAMLARVLHDDLGGLLVSAIMDLGWVEQQPQTNEALRLRLARVRSALGAAIDLKRNLIEELRPSLLDNFGLLAAFRWHVKHACKRASVECVEHYPSEELALRPEATAGLFRIMQQMLMVVLGEASLKAVEVTVAVEENELMLHTAHTHELVEVSDMFKRHPVEMGAVRRRIVSLGGRLDVDRRAAGTLLKAHFPLSHVLA